MTDLQLKKIKEFAKIGYQKTDQFHDLRHALLTVKYAKELARQYENVNFPVLICACLLHDIGRVNKDIGHPEESARIAEPFLVKIGVGKAEREEILHAISVHAKERIHEAKTIEAKLLFDADKLQILSVYGFLRVTFFLVNKRGWSINKSLKFMWDYVKSTYKDNIQTPLAKKILATEIKKIEILLKDYKRGLKGKLLIETN